ncbi:MAG TPA: hypothetical protein VF533_03205, partial [Solirubrobacteraceae bacterium]
SFASCTTDGINRIRLEGEGGDDAMRPDARVPTQFAFASNGGPGDDVLGDLRTGSAARAVLDGGPGKDQLRGGAGQDELLGGPDADRLAGDAGNDVLEPDPASGMPAAAYAGDVLSGGAGIDTVAYTSRVEFMRLSLDAAANDGAEGEGDDVDSDDGVENLQPSSGGNRIVLDDKANVVIANDTDWPGPTGDDVVFGRGGADQISAGDGDDVIAGGAGDDLLMNSGGSDSLIGGPGDDRLFSLHDDPDDRRAAAAEAGTAVHAIFYPGPGRDSMLAGGQDDRALMFDGEVDNISCNEGDVPDDDRIVADGADSVTGCATTEYIKTGRVGVVFGLLTFQAVAGQANRLAVQQVSDSTYRVKDALPVQPGRNCTALSATEVQCGTVMALGIRTGDRDDTVALTGGRPSGIFGGPGNDTLTGGAGPDRLDGGAGGDVIAGGAGTDTATYADRTLGVTVDLDGVRDDGNRLDGSTAGTRDDVQPDVENLTGGAGPDVLRAPRADGVANVLAGNAGDDRLATRDGTGTVDRLFCGLGSDRFDRDPSDAISGCETAGTLP